MAAISDVITAGALTSALCGMSLSVISDLANKQLRDGEKKERVGYSQHFEEGRTHIMRHYDIPYISLSYVTIMTCISH